MSCRLESMSNVRVQGQADEFYQAEQGKETG